MFDEKNQSMFSKICENFTALKEEFSSKPVRAARPIKPPSFFIEDLTMDLGASRSSAD